jgi:hypothetical protein
MSLLGITSPTTAAPVKAYQVPTGKQTTVNVGATNVSLTDAASVSIYIVPSGASGPLVTNALEYSVSLANNLTPLERSGVTLGAGDSVYVSASNPTVNFFIFGIEAVA